MPEPRTSFHAVVEALKQSEVRFVIIGGVAMRLQGSAHITDDIDICYARDPNNLTALVRGLASHAPRLRTRSGDIPFLWDERTLQNSLNFTLRTDLGDIDLLGEAPGVDSFENLWQRASAMDLEGIEVRVASIADLISMKRAANRPKDQAHLMELEALRKLIQDGQDQLSDN